MPYIYIIVTIISFIVLSLFIIISDRKVLFYNASFFIFVFIGNLGYMTLGFSTNLQEAILAYKLTFLCGCSLSLFLMMLVLILQSSFFLCPLDIPTGFTRIVI